MLGVLYYFGNGVDRDYRQAVEYFQRAANANDAAAQYHLGLCYLESHGVRQDPVKARELLQLAADNGEKRAADKLNELK